MAKTKPIPFRPDDGVREIIAILARQTGMSQSEVLRRACRFSLPKFASGEVDISRVIEPAPEAVTH
jgi:DNA-directed RNA polymerase alpha subunit